MGNAVLEAYKELEKEKAEGRKERGSYIAGIGKATSGAISYLVEEAKNLAYAVGPKTAVATVLGCAINPVVGMATLGIAATGKDMYKEGKEAFLGYLGAIVDSENGVHLEAYEDNQRQRVGLPPGTYTSTTGNPILNTITQAQKYRGTVEAANKAKMSLEEFVAKRTEKEKIQGLEAKINEACLTLQNGQDITQEQESAL